MCLYKSLSAIYKQLMSGVIRLRRDSTAKKPVQVYYVEKEKSETVVLIRHASNEMFCIETLQATLLAWILILIFTLLCVRIHAHVSLDIPLKILFLTIVYHLHIVHLFHMYYLNAYLRACLMLYCIQSGRQLWLKKCTYLIRMGHGSWQIFQ